MINLSPNIFKAYDIRGIVGKTLDTSIAKVVGKAIGSKIVDAGGTEVSIGFDGRHSSPSLSESLSIGLQSTGLKVLNIGCVTTPMLYFSTHVTGSQNGVMITGSHNPADYNGFKIVIAGETLYGQKIQDIFNKIKNKNFRKGHGRKERQSVTEKYLKTIKDDISLNRRFKIVVDCGNGIAGNFAPTLFKNLGCEVIELFCDVDGSFPNHHPDPSRPENLVSLIKTVKKNHADFGLAFDGDGDRVGLVDANGTVIQPDRQLMLLAADILRRQPNTPMIFDVKCSRNLGPWIKKHGGKPVMHKTGHSFIKAKMRELDSPLGGEMSGHIFLKERWYGFDDGLYAGARLLECLSNEKNPQDALARLPNSINTPELHILFPEGGNHNFVREMSSKAEFANAIKIIDIDGLRVEYENGFGLIRASNTTPVVVCRFEATSNKDLLAIQKEFKKCIMRLNPKLEIPF